MGLKTWRLVVAAGLLGLNLAETPAWAAPPRAVTMSTQSLTPPEGGYLHCLTIATSTGPIGIVARVLDEQGQNLTAYGTSYRASPDVTGNGLYYAEETAGTVTDIAGHCEVDVTNARKRDVHVIFTAHDVDDQEVDRVER